MTQDPEGTTPEAEPAARGLVGRLRTAVATLGEFFLDSGNARAADLWLASIRAAEGESDMEVRRSLDAELRAGVPAYVGIDSVYSDEGLVVYAVEEKGEGICLYRRKYDMTDGKVRMKGVPEDVKAVMKYEPVEARSTEPPPGNEQRAACACQDHALDVEATSRSSVSRRPSPVSHLLRSTAPPSRAKGRQRA